MFAVEVQALSIPQFFLRVPPGGFFDDGDNFTLLEKENLLRDFRLGACDTHINFGGMDTEVYQVDLEQTGKDDYRPSFKKVDSRRKALMNEHILTLPRDSQVKNLAARFTGMVGNMYPIPTR